MEARVGYRFFAVPVHQLSGSRSFEAAEELLEPESADVRVTVERALQGTEYRDMRARDRLRSLLHSDLHPSLPSPGKGCGRSAVFAQPPQDLPALLRLADQLDRLTTQEAGERALV